MAFNNRDNKFNNRNVRAKVVTCSCGGQSKLTSRKNYSFGKKSNVKTKWFYRCGSCGDVKLASSEKGGRRR